MANALKNLKKTPTKYIIVNSRLGVDELKIIGEAKTKKEATMKWKKAKKTGVSYILPSKDKKYFK